MNATPRRKAMMAEANNQASHLLDALADRIENQKNSYRLAHSGLATHLFEVISREIRAVANGARRTATDD